MICHRHLADWLSFIDLTTASLLLFLVDYRIKSTGTLTHPKASFGPALELSRSPRPRVFCQQYHNFKEKLMLFRYALRSDCRCFAISFSLYPFLYSCSVRATPFLRFMQNSFQHPCRKTQANITDMSNIIDYASMHQKIAFCRENRKCKLMGELLEPGRTRARNVNTS
jgi:hypothetical protein